MKYIDWVEMACLAAKQLKKPCMYIHHNVDGYEVDWDELIKAAPYLSFHFLPVEESMLLVFDSTEEIEEAYWLTVGDDGPTEKNPYNGPAKVYALTIGPDGLAMNENT